MRSVKLAATIGGAAVGLLACNSVVAPFAITMEPMVGEPIGQAHTFRITKVEGAVGKVSFRWNFGDGTPPITTSGIEAAHTYKEVGHYTVIVRATDTATGAAAQSQFVQTAHNPLTPRPPHNSTSIFIDEEHHEVWNVNPDKGSVSVIDANKLRRIREAPVGDEPHSLAPAPDGAIWVTNQMSDEVVVLDRSSGKIERRIGLPYASQPRAIAFGPNGKAYVSLFATGKLVEIDPISPDVRREVALGPTPAGVSVADDGRIFVTRFISPGDPGGKTPGELGHGEVWVVSPETLTLKNTIELPFDPGPDTESAGRGVPNYVSSIAISPDGTRAWASAKKDNVARGPERDGLPADSDNIVRAIVCVIDLKTEKEILAERIDIDNRSMVVAVAFSRVGDYGYLLLEANNWIGIYEVYNGGVAPPQLGGIKDVGSDEGAAHGGDGAPDGLAISRNGRLFVNAFLSRQVIAYDLSASIASVAHAPPPLLAKIRTIDQEPLPERVLRGKKVFFNAMDPRMSNVGYMASRVTSRAWAMGAFGIFRTAAKACATPSRCSEIGGWGKGACTGARTWMKSRISSATSTTASREGASCPRRSTARASIRRVTTIRSASRPRE
jgi:sugar lactone lactonase YvrE